MPTKILKSLFILVPFVVVLALFVIKNRVDNQTVQPETNNAEVLSESAENLNDQVSPVTLTVMLENLEQLTFSKVITDQVSASAWLKTVDQENETLQIAFTEFSFGEFVSGINGIAPASNEAFWSFNVNGKASEVGVSDYHVQPGDKLEFKLEKILP